MKNVLRVPMWYWICALAAVTLYFLWGRHSTHILGALPYAFLLLCPLMHYFMHGGHSKHGGNGESGKS
jgi:hypothetical protein